jgi:hypothetical protein
MTGAPRVKDYKILDRLTPCPVSGSHEWWFDGAAWCCCECEPAA